MSHALALRSVPAVVVLVIAATLRRTAVQVASLTLAVVSGLVPTSFFPTVPPSESRLSLRIRQLDGYR